MLKWKLGCYFIYTNIVYIGLRDMTGRLHYDDVTRTPCSLKSPIFWLFVQQLMRIHIEETSKSALLALCEGNPPVTSECLSQMASNAEKAYILWRNNGVGIHQWPVDSLTKVPVKPKLWPCHDIIMHWLLTVCILDPTFGKKFQET